MTAVDTTLPHPFARRTGRPRPLGLLSGLAGVILTLKPTSRGSPDVPAWLRRDVGLPPAPETRTFWDLG